MWRDKGHIYASSCKPTVIYICTFLTVFGCKMLLGLYAKKQFTINNRDTIKRCLTAGKLMLKKKDRIIVMINHGGWRWGWGVGVDGDRLSRLANKRVSHMVSIKSLLFSITSLNWSWRHFMACHHWPFVRESRWSPGDSPHKGPVLISLRKAVERTNSRVSVDFTQYYA